MENWLKNQIAILNRDRYYSKWVYEWVLALILTSLISISIGFVTHDIALRIIAITVTVFTLLVMATTTQINNNDYNMLTVMSRSVLEFMLKLCEFNYVLLPVILLLTIGGILCQ